LRGGGLPAAAAGVRTPGDRERGRGSRDDGDHPTRDRPSHCCSPLAPPDRREGFTLFAPFARCPADPEEGPVPSEGQETTTTTMPGAGCSRLALSSAARL